MNEPMDTFAAKLVRDNNETAVTASYKSRFTLGIAPVEKQSVKNGETFDSIIINDDAGPMELGGCRFILGTSGKNGTGILYFMKDLYDFDVLFNEKTLVNYESYYNNLILILKQKEQVKEEFIIYTSRLTYDLNVYKNYFNDIDHKIEEEPAESREQVRQTLLDTEGRRFMSFFDSKVNELEELTRDYTREEHESHGFFFRKHLWSMILCSQLMTRTNLKPRGYAGDSEMMRMVYENEYAGNSSFEKIMHKYGVEVPAAQAVRNRRIMVPKIMRKVQQEFREDGDVPLRMMSVACGPAYELRDLFLSENDIHRFEITLLDQDEQALSEAEANIKLIENELGFPVKVNYIRDSVRTMLRTRNIDEKWGTFNFTYSMGLFDYLTPPVAKIVIEKMYSMLEPGGQLLVGNYHIDNPSRVFMEYWLDWVLYYRDEEEFKALLRDTDAVDINVFFEDTKSQVFLNARKPV